MTTQNQADNTTIELTKIEAARRQIDTAVGLYFTDGDSVSAYALTFAASDVLRNFAEAGSIKTVYDDFLSHIRPDRKKEFLDLLRKPQMFIKHADQNPDSILVFHPRSYEIPLYLVCELYAEITESPTTLMEMYHIWILSENPNYITSPESFKTMLVELSQKKKDGNIEKQYFYEHGLENDEVKSLVLLKASAIGNNKRRRGS